MYGNKVIPGIKSGQQYRTLSSLWVGYTESTWFDYVDVTGTEEKALPLGTILKENAADGTYSPFEAGDIISAPANLPGVRLVIVADETAVTGSSETTGEGASAVTTSLPSSVLVGKQGQVDKARILVGETPFAELEEAQQVKLNTQLEAWNFQLVSVLEG
ncbi:MAG: hypothetical protein IJP96_07035 [Synergistaceae bacterium]|nr:hypothetical protein [Synergistaceae bacterium]MBR0315673.1 hypothetical protein [Synergistaceae bacterium]